MIFIEKSIKIDICSSTRTFKTESNKWNLYPNMFTRDYFYQITVLIAWFLIFKKINFKNRKSGKLKLIFLLKITETYNKNYDKKD